VVPKGNPAGKQAMTAIASMQQPEGQVKNCSVRWATARPIQRPRRLVPADLKGIDPGSPANAAVQAKIDADWYEKNYSKARQEFLDMIAS